MATEFASNPLFNDANCVAYYKMEDLNDSKGSATLSNRSSYFTFTSGLFNNAATGQLTVQRAALYRAAFGLDISANLTISMWVKSLVALSSSGQSTRILLWGSTTGNARLMELSYYRVSGQTTKLSFVIGATSMSPIVLDRTLEDGWHHICITISSTGYVTWYIDNQVVGTGQCGANTTLKNELDIGGDSSNSRGFMGQIDDVVIFNRELTPSEVSSIYTDSSHFIPQITII